MKLEKAFSSQTINNETKNIPGKCRQRDQTQHPNVISVCAIMYQQQMNFEH